MNISEFERQLREAQRMDEFQPQEAAWLRLRQSIGPKQQRTRLLAFPLLLRWSAAAGIVLLISIGVYTGIDSPAPSALKVDRAPLPQNALPTRADSVQPEHVAETGDVARNVNVVSSPGPRSVASSAKAALSQSDPVRQASDSASPVHRSPGPDPVIAVREPAIAPAQVPRFGSPEPERQPDAGRKLQFGISAQYGRSDISSGQYRLALDARRYLSGRVFASVQLTASAATITNSDEYRYQSFGFSPGTGASMVTQPATAHYRGNVFSVGISPSLGIRAGKKLALSAGPDLQKRLGGSLTLSNKGDFRNQVTNETLIEERQEIADFDFGLHSSVQLQLNRRVDVSMMYRYGLSNYLGRHLSSLRNSYLAAGLSFRLNR